MGCGCKDPQEGLDIQSKPATLPAEAIDEFQSKINSLQSEKNIWKQSYENLSSQVNAITSKLDALLETLPENIQQQFNEAFQEAPVAAKTLTNGRTDKLFKFSVEVYLEVSDDLDVCEIMDDIDIVPLGKNTNMLEVRVGDLSLEPTNLDELRAKVNSNVNAKIVSADADPELF